MAELIDPRVLHAELESHRPPVLLDVRWSLGGPPGRGLYNAGHIPGARFVDLEQDLSAPPRTTSPGGRHPLPDPAVFQRAMRRAGVSARSRVVVYDTGDGYGAARAWWCLRYFGGPDAAVLDGGYRAWAEAGLPVEDVTPKVEPGSFTAEPGRMPLLDADAAQRLAKEGLLLDARATGRFKGEGEIVDPVAGHIPGAVSAPTADNTLPNGRFRAVDELRERFTELGADAPVPVGVYCGSGVTAAHEVLALELSGVEAALYVGSWSDWITDPGRPIA